MFLILLHVIDDPVLGQLIESLPPLRPCELLDPADDQTLPHLVEVLERRHRIRQTITEQVNRTGKRLNLAFSACLCGDFALFIEHNVEGTRKLKNPKCWF